MSVARLSLTAFRNYREARLDLDAPCVVLVGPNGSGKTNILEALSLLVPGRGLRRASASDWQNATCDGPWAVAVDIETPAGRIAIGTGGSGMADGPDRRLVLIDGRAARSQLALADIMAMAWITPEMDRVLAEGASARRRFFDRLACSFDPAHAGRVIRYDKALRERLRLLREGRAETAWLDGLENDMAQTGVAMAATRRELWLQLQARMDEGADAFPRADLALIGMAEERLAHEPALLVEDRLRAALAAGRAQDAETGTCGTGPHRSDMSVLHRAHGRHAEDCSTGEQKALLIAVMLAYVRVLKEARGFAPLVLLDDIAAHLDETRRAALYEALSGHGGQVWMTGTNRAQFDAMPGSTAFIRVQQGAL